MGRSVVIAGLVALSLGSAPALAFQEMPEPRVYPLHNLFAPDMDTVGRIGASISAAVWSLASAQACSSSYNRIRYCGIVRPFACGPRLC